MVGSKKNKRFVAKHRNNADRENLDNLFVEIRTKKVVERSRTHAVSKKISKERPLVVSKTDVNNLIGERLSNLDV
jgi:hypothetical protein